MLGQRFQIKAFDIFRKNFSFQVPCSRCLYSGCSREILHNILILFAKSQSFFHEIISYFVKCFTLHPTFRNLRCSIRKTVLKNLPIFTGKQLCWNLFLIKLIKKSTQVLSCKYCEIFINTILQNICEWLLFYIIC